MTCPHPHAAGQCSTISSTAHAGSNGRPLPSWPGWAPCLRPDRSFPRFGGESGRIGARRQRRVTRRAPNPPLELSDPLVLLGYALLQPPDLLIHPQQHRDDRVATLRIDRLGLRPLHTRNIPCKSRKPCPDTDRLNAYRKPFLSRAFSNTATGIRTPVSAVRGRRPSPLDDSGESTASLANALPAPGPARRPPNRPLAASPTVPRAISSPAAGGCGGIGRRARFRSVWRQLRGGSSPLIRTRHAERVPSLGRGWV
ncbi:MAG: hypothetical protein QOE44_2866 [Solirubrobacteraceae bacterium]|nr:hypothetical protein [Solirubrobacteraceae bacterium]